MRNSLFSYYPKAGSVQWNRFCSTYLDAKNENSTDKSRKLSEDHIKDFVFDSGRTVNIALIDKKNIHQNKVQVINQFEQNGSHLNRYDVTILINGLPLVHVELKRRGVRLVEAFNQIHRYSKESFNSNNSLYKYVQLFVISNGTDTKYFSNTTSRSKNNFESTINWADYKNKTINDLKGFTQCFFAKKTILEILVKYCVFNSENQLLVMRPYQIAATERIINKINSTYLNYSKDIYKNGGFIWHTTGSGKTLTSFKAAQLATQLDFVDKVLFVVDRKDLDYQTMKEYKKFNEDSVNGSESTAGLLRNINSNDNKIIVTTIQKLNILMKKEKNLDIYKKYVVLIFDEAHRSQFGEAQNNIKMNFKKFCQFGFTGTPILPKNSVNGVTTQSIFGKDLHKYVITDAIRDKKVLQFNVDCLSLKPRNSESQSENSNLEFSKKDYENPNRIEVISKYILNNYDIKTHRKRGKEKGFNAIFAVSSIDAAKMYYESLNNLQKDSYNKLKIATIFSFSANEDQKNIGEIQEEDFNTNEIDTTNKAFLSAAIEDYNKLFSCNYSVESNSFQDYYRDVSKRVKNKEVDLLIVVGMFLTGFDAPTLNTLFIDKNVSYHGLIQAFSRTNRVLDRTKKCGHIVSFRNIEKETKEAISVFGDCNSLEYQIVIQKKFSEYLNGFFDESKNRNQVGYIEIVDELISKFNNIDRLFTENEKYEFVKLYGKFLNIEKTLQNFDEYTIMKLLSSGLNDDNIINDYQITKEKLNELKKIPIIDERSKQDYSSRYFDIREEISKRSNENEDLSKWDDVVFEIELLKSLDINLEYILELIYQENKQNYSHETFIEKSKKYINSSIALRDKEGLILEFIKYHNFTNENEIMGSFVEFSKQKLNVAIEQLIEEEKLNPDEAHRYILESINNEFATENGTGLTSILPKMSPLNPNYLTKKNIVFNKVIDIVNIYKGTI